MRHIRLVSKAQVNAEGILTLFRAILDVILGFIGGKAPSS